MQPLEGDVTAFRLIGELDLAGVEACREALDAACATGAVVELDLGSLELISSSGLALLATLDTRCRALGGRLCVTHMSEPVRQMLAMTGLDQRFEMRVDGHGAAPGAPSELHLRGEIDLAVRPGLREAIDDLLASDVPTLVVDLGEVTFMDSTGLAELARLSRDGRRVILRNPSDQVLRNLDILGLRSSMEVLDGPGARRAGQGRP